MSKLVIEGLLEFSLYSTPSVVCAVDRDACRDGVCECTQTRTLLRQLSLVSHTVGRGAKHALFKNVGIDSVTAVKLFFRPLISPLSPCNNGELVRFLYIGGVGFEFLSKYIGNLPSSLAPLFVNLEGLWLDAPSTAVSPSRLCTYFLDSFPTQFHHPSMPATSLYRVRLKASPPFHAFPKLTSFVYAKRAAARKVATQFLDGSGKYEMMLHSVWLFSNDIADVVFNAPHRVMRLALSCLSIPALQATPRAIGVEVGELILHRVCAHQRTLPLLLADLAPRLRRLSIQNVFIDPSLSRKAWTPLRSLEYIDFIDVSFALLGLLRASVIPKVHTAWIVQEHYDSPRHPSTTDILSNLSDSVRSLHVFLHPEDFSAIEALKEKTSLRTLGLGLLPYTSDVHLPYPPRIEDEIFTAYRWLPSGVKVLYTHCPVSINGLEGLTGVLSMHPSLRSWHVSATVMPFIVDSLIENGQFDGRLVFRANHFDNAEKRFVRSRWSKGSELEEDNEPIIEMCVERTDYSEQTRVVT